jgi:hypothetical protein
VEQDDNPRVGKCGVPNGTSANWLESHESGGDLETNKGGLYEAKIVLNDFLWSVELEKSLKK